MLCFIYFGEDRGPKVHWSGPGGPVQSFIGLNKPAAITEERAIPQHVPIYGFLEGGGDDGGWWW